MKAFELEKELVQLGKWRSGRHYDHYFFPSKFCQNLELSCGSVCHVTEGLFQQFTLSCRQSSSKKEMKQQKHQ
jgi:hypothetical protein